MIFYLKIKSQSEKTFEEEFNFIEKRVYEFILGGLGAKELGQSPKHDLLYPKPS